MEKYQYVYEKNGEYILVKGTSREATSKERKELNVLRIIKQSERPAKKSEIESYKAAEAKKEADKILKARCRSIAEYIMPANAYLSISKISESIYVKGVLGETNTTLCRVSDHRGRAILDSMYSLYADSTQEEIDKIKTELAKLQLVKVF